MVNKLRTIDFLPEIFKTDTNRQFLSATLDVLTQQPKLSRVQGFIGAKYGYGVEPNDKYVVEPSKTRRDYQLEPSVVFLKTDTQTAKDFINYPGIVQALANEGAVTTNPNNLFSADFYSWDPFISLDKVVNYAQYYWIPGGPDALTISTNTVYLNAEYTVTGSDNGITFQGIPVTNPPITLLRGGTYQFIVDQPSAFWLQGIPGISSYESINSRDVLGVTNNGAKYSDPQLISNIITYKVPTSEEVASYTFSGNNVVDLVSNLTYESINGQVVTIDGVTPVDGSTLMFYDNGQPSRQEYFYTISVPVTGGVVSLTQSSAIPNEQNIVALTGTEYIGRTFVRNLSGLITEIPFIGNTLFYQDGSDSLSVGIINLIDTSAANVINVVTDILGKKTYTSPNGVKFTNGLKVAFEANAIPVAYRNTEFYVEGVGTAIELLPVSKFVSYETDTGYVPTRSEYITISRSSRDYNAWTRANRWFHQEVLDVTSAILGAVSNPITNAPVRAQRPILEFRGNLKLFNSGTESLGTITVVDTTNTDALSTIIGQSSYTIDGHVLADGDTVIFTADTSAEVRRNIYVVSFATPPSDLDPVINLTPTGSLVTENSQVYVISGDAYIGTSWWFTLDGQVWVEAQYKSQINQPPLYDIFNINGISLSNISFYPGSTFRGSDLFSYATGTGANDPILGFPISYSSVANIGDINFDVNLNSDVFTHSDGQNSPVTENINIGYVHYSPAPDVIEKKTGWVPAAGPSVQYQVFEFDVTETTTDFVCDVPAQTVVNWANAQVYVNDQIKDESQFTVTIGTATTTITLSTPALAGFKVTVLLISDTVSTSAYFEVPDNLENNPFNTNITTLSVGDLQNQYRRIFVNANGVTGELFGDNNIHDLGDLNPFGDAIVQSSSSLVLPGTFLRKQEYSLVDALQFNSREYINYKSLLVNLASATDYSIYQQPADILDNIISQIASAKNSTNSFFWSDMLFSGSPYTVNSYSFALDEVSVSFALGRIYDFSSANYYGLGIYLTRTVSNVETYTQLVKGIDYVVSTDSPSVTVTYPIIAGDVITVKEYNQTYGNYCPNTPTKIGLYPSFLPGIILDNTYTTPTYFLQGHDGSYNTLYGTYVDGQLDDFRDIVLLEFETRVYNNIKVSGVIPLTGVDVIPGEWRTTGYSRSEILSIYSTNFLNWVGQNRIDYKQQIFSNVNEFTYNYNQSSNKLTNTTMQQGYWRGIYNWLYDSTNPADAPWELLGFTSQPIWWTARYGAAPYTSGNTLMWAEISEGFVWNAGNSYTDDARVRPGLLSALPVDGGGNLLSPLDNIIGNYNRLSFNRDWIVGDGAPAEASYLKSSSWPFDLMRLLSLTKPAQFYNLCVDRDRYKFNAELNQYLYDDRYHLDPRTVQVYGNGTSKNSYINWIVDYVNQRGVDGTTLITSLLANLDVRLTYSLAGFSAKNYLKFLVEKATPTSNSNSLLIPDDSYTVLLHDNIPEEKISYSSVIIQKTSQGWTVWGNSQNKPYFTVVVPKQTGRSKTIKVNAASVTLTTEYYSDTTAQIPYGTLLYSLQAVGEFLQNYGRYLIEQGVLFQNILAGQVYDWDRMVQEFLYWAQQSWQVGSTISLNPNAKLLSINREGLVVQPLTIQQQNFVLNQNLLPIQSQDSAIIRENTSFSIKIISEGDTVAYTNLNLASIEHAVVFDNTTVFNDIIYNLTTGLRQSRLVLQGYKTAEWNGYVDAQGFILNEDNIKEWAANVKYTKGVIVLYKNLYWTSKKLIQPGNDFNKEDWQEIDYDTMKSGMLPNPSTTAYESLYYYDINRANLENDTDLLAFSLIGYRPRDYMLSADLSDITQINVYKNLIAEKGTNLVANAFKQAQLVQGAIDYHVQENWAIKAAEFGNVLGSNFVEAELEQAKLTGNPTIIGFTDNYDVPEVQQSIKISELVNFERPPLTPNFLPLYGNNYTIENGLPTAGYVNLNDAKFQEYIYDYLNDTSTNIQNLYFGNNIWIANYKSSWDIFTPESLNTQVIQALNAQNGDWIFTFASPHGLVKNDLFAIVNFDTAFDRFYTVKSINSLLQVVVTYSAPESLTQATLTGNGVGFKLKTRRVVQASDLASVTVTNSQFFTRRAWVDYDVDNHWAVWAASPVFAQTTVAIDPVTDLGTGVGYTNSVGYLAGDSSLSTVFRYDNGRTQQLTGSAGFGTTIKAFGDAVYITSINSVYVYQLNTTLDSLELVQQINVSNTGAIAVSSDQQWLYVADVEINTIYVYARNSVDQYEHLAAANLVGPALVGWGTSIATSVDGVKLLVGAPNEDYAIATNDSGAAYLYSRRVQRFQATGTSNTFELAAVPPDDVVDVYVDDVLTDAYVTLQYVQVQYVDPDTGVPSTIPVGSIVTIDTGSLEYVTKFTSDTPQIGGLFGNSVDTNRYGAELLIGAPYDINNRVEGAVYRFTNAGQKYGVISGTNPSVNTGDIIFIDGYQITFSASTTPSEISQQINDQTAINIVATGDDTDNTLMISVRSSTVEVVNNILDITGDPTIIAALGFTLYTKTQIIQNPDASAGQFGWTIKMNERDGLVVNAPTATRLSPCQFDYSPDYKENDTIFDNGATMFIDNFANNGVVYAFDVLPANNESIDNPSKYVFGQYIATSDTDNISLQPKFGINLAYTDGVIVTGSPVWYSDGSGLFLGFVPSIVPDYDSSVVKPSSWFIDKKPLPSVNINRLRTVQLYNGTNNTTLEYLDYIDPGQGKLLGALTTNLDYISDTDPAGYTGSSVTWTVNHVGNTWLDTRTIRLVNYHQPSLVYNSSNWGKAFAGSTADVYTWIESTVPPSEYAGNGYVIDFEQFITTTVLNRSTNSLMNMYYFWVKGYSALPQGKTLSPLTLSQYLLDPLSSGISFLAPVTTNVVSLYNCNDSIQDYTSILHLGYAQSENTGQAHQSWSMIKEGVAEDFLTGLPTIINKSPSGLYLKLLDSFSGLDTQGLPVPDPQLPVLVKYGVSTRPRQSMFINRYVALDNYLSYANDILIQLPIVEIRNLGFLKTSGLTYDTSNYWETVNWWAAGYNNNTKPAIEVATYTDLLRIQQNVILTGTAQGNVLLVKGLVARVKTNNMGNSEYYVYDPATSPVWTRIGVENGTIQILSSLWDGPYGWSTTGYSVDIWDYWPSEETRWIIRWLNEQCYINELIIERNRSLILMFKYIQSESLQQNNYLPWLNKTSLVDVNHRIRELLPYKKFQRDNQEFLAGYLNEAKPYHVYIKNFVYSYDGLDVYGGNLTDFDLPAVYNPQSGDFESPQLVYSNTYNPNQYLPTDPIWQQQEYSQWFNNYGLSVTNSVMIVNQGRGYTDSPRISAYIDTSIYPEPREVATFTAIMSADKVIGITVDNPGSGYAVDPVIVIEPSISEAFTPADVDIVGNTITLSEQQFFTGDGVSYVSNDGPLGLSQSSYYYIRVIDPYSVAFYETYTDAVNVANPAEKLPVFDNRINLLTTGSGTISVNARAICFTSVLPVRSMKISMRYDRVGYRLTDGWDNTNIAWDIQTWDEQSPSAIRSIYDYYQPTANMPGRDFPQLMQGIEYPNATYQGLPFPDESPLDTYLLSPSMSSTDSTVYGVQGGQFTDGYGPEELVAGVVSDNVQITVSTADTQLNFRISVDKYGYLSVHNVNSVFTQTVLTTDFVSTGSITDVISVADASVLVDVTTHTITTAPIIIDIDGVPTVFGVATVSGIDAKRMTAPIILSISGIPMPNAFTWRSINADTIELTISGTSTTTLDATFTVGNVLLLKNEFIGFSSIDLTTNTVTGLRRGLSGTITNSFVAAMTVVQSVLARDMLPVEYNEQWWYGPGPYILTTTPGVPPANVELIASTQPAALFLQRTSP